MMTTLNTEATLGAVSHSGALITPPATPDTVQGNAVHRWSALSISSINSGDIQPSLSSLYTSQQSSSSTTSSLGFDEISDKSNPKISTNVFLDFMEIIR